MTTSASTTFNDPLLIERQEHILQKEDGKDRFVQVVTELSQAFALCAGTEEAIEIRDDIGFFQAVKAALAKKRGERKSTEDPITQSGN